MGKLIQRLPSSSKALGSQCFLLVIKCPAKDGGPLKVFQDRSLSGAEIQRTSPHRKFRCPAVTQPNSDIQSQV